MALTFANPTDYIKILEDDLLSIIGLTTFSPGVPLTLRLRHANGYSEEILLNHTYNESQIVWFKAGSALNHLKK